MKKQYNQTEVQMTPIQSVSVLCASPTPPSSNNMGINTGIPTDEQW